MTSASFAQLVAPSFTAGGFPQRWANGTPAVVSWLVLVAHGHRDQ